MPEYNIKISELDTFPSASDPLRTEDFFPLVNSSSMTTYRATIQDIGLLITHSIYADTASYLLNYKPTVSASWASASISSSYALTASYAVSASHANLSDSSSYYPPQNLVISCSWASASISASWAARAFDVDTHGPVYNFPYWTSDTPGAGNGNLLKNSPLFYYVNPDQSSWLLTFDSASTNVEYELPSPIQRPDFKRWRFSEQANIPWFFAGNSGIQSMYPIVSHTFVGTDHRGWFFTTSSTPHNTPLWYTTNQYITNSYYSGSAGDASSGSFYTIPDQPGALAQIFNGKWVRFVSFGGSPYENDAKPTADHSAMGEVWGIPDQIMKGLISIEVGSTSLGGSNILSKVDMWVHGSIWGGGQSATVFHVHNNNGTLIRAFRISCGKGYNSIDPPLCIDMLIDGLRTNEPALTVRAQSWQGIRFLKWLNVDPWSPAYTGSNDITKDDSQLIFPAAPGFYTNTPKTLNYNIQGQNVMIWPTPNNITQSGLAVPSIANNQSFYVSGGIETNTQFFCKGSPGLTTQVTYGSTTLYFVGGILVNKIPPDIGPPPALPCGGPFRTTVVGGNSISSNALYSDTTYQIGQNIGNISFKYGSANGTLALSDPTRYQFLSGGIVVYDSDWRGLDTGSSISSPEVIELSQSLAHWVGTSKWPSTLPSTRPTYILKTPPLGETYYKSKSTDTTITVRTINPLEERAYYTMSCPGVALPP